MSRTDRPAGSYTKTTEKAGASSSDPGFALLVSCEAGVYIVPLGGRRDFVIGRVPECDIVIEDASVSRKHARLTIGESMMIEDLGSTNGTTAQGRVLAPSEKVGIAVGSVFELGSATFVLQRARGLSLQPSVPPKPSVQARSSSRHSIAPAERVVSDATMRNLYALLDVVAPSPLSILILGETGVGKEVYAEAVHKRSARADGPYLQLNCAALAESILEGELFGYEKGAFTGAVQAKAGLFEAGHGGTVFLDEVGELPMSIQSKLLRALETGHVQRLGSVKPKVVDVRFVSATNRDLRQLIAQGLFRPDLYFRLNGMSITLPPLRSRKADIAALARHFVERVALSLGKPEMLLSDAAVASLEAYEWPGNVRELRNVIERVVVMCPSTTIGLEHLAHADPETFGAARSTSAQTWAAAPRHTIPAMAHVAEATGTMRALGGLREEMRAMEKDRILDALSKCAGNQSQAARMLGMSRYTLIARIEEYGLARPRKGR